MFVLMPKCPYTEEYYLPSIVEGFSLGTCAKNPEGVGAYLNYCMASRDSDIAKEIGKKKHLRSMDEHRYSTICMRPYVN